MVKEYYPISIEKLNKEIKDEEKIKEMIHNKFCRYIYSKGKNKNKMCLNGFKDINEMKLCHTHRWENKPWLQCITINCKGKTKINICKNCKKMYNTRLPEVNNDEIISLSTEYIHKEFIKIIIPNALYSIKYNNNYINISLFKSVLFKNIIKKQIKDNEYCMFLFKRKINKIIKNNINNYMKIKSNNLKKLLNVFKIIIKLKKIRNKYISIDKICNIPLPPVSIDEEILLNININDLYEKKIKDSNDEVLELNISNNNLDKIKFGNKKLQLEQNINNKYNLLINNLYRINKKQKQDILIINTETPEVKLNNNLLNLFNKSQTSDKCKKCDTILENLYDINRNVGEEMLIINSTSYSVYLNNRSSIIKKSASPKIDNIKLKKYFNRFMNSLIELEFDKISKLTPKPFIQHKAHIKQFEKNMNQLLNINNNIIKDNKNALSPLL